MKLSTGQPAFLGTTTWGSQPYPVQVCASFLAFFSAGVAASEIQLRCTLAALLFHPLDSVRGAISDLHAYKQKIQEANYNPLCFRINEDDIFGDGTNFQVRLLLPSTKNGRGEVSQGPSVRSSCIAIASALVLEGQKPSTGICTCHWHTRQSS
eukprot:1145378-Pelagomonas_calceolata.AAC.15